MKRYRFILKLVFEKFLNLQSQLNHHSSTMIQYSSVYNIDILNNIKEKLKDIEINIEVDIKKHCIMEPSNMFLLANKLKAKYTNIKFRENVPFYNAGNEIILSEIKILILENYTKLGLKFISNALDHDFKKTDDECANSPARIPVFYDFFQKEADNESASSPATIPVTDDFFQKDNECSNSPATIPVTYDFFQKDLVGDTIMNEAFEIDTEDHTKKVTPFYYNYI
ncbi:uncharacterized protein LOC126899780 isoform X2 [Daktulosphaira vitifoliae]|uniref:uncharacterized protein LOC126899780 isoform X2 n=1 Tax=Daktulosphaira vitifoliae TaxID=58002 RepID=UPI0021A9FC8E|nr:uncharacterized protein LOC126899780 isoform X2 [Daktulosphaira vitifoliae]